MLKTTQLSAHAQNYASPELCPKSFTMIFLGDHDNNVPFTLPDKLRKIEKSFELRRAIKMIRKNLTTRIDIQAKDVVLCQNKIILKNFNSLK